MLNDFSLTGSVLDTVLVSSIHSFYPVDYYNILEWLNTWGKCKSQNTGMQAES